VIDIIVLLLWLLITILLGSWWAESQKEWFKRLSARGLVSEDTRIRFHLLPGRWFFSMLGDIPAAFRLNRRPDTDHATELWRLRMRRRGRIFLLWLFPTSVVYLVLASLGSWAVREIQEPGRGDLVTAILTLTVIGGLVIILILIIPRLIEYGNAAANE
jgi:hypothetical protein